MYSIVVRTRKYDSPCKRQRKNGIFGVNRHNVRDPKKQYKLKTIILYTHPRHVPRAKKTDHISPYRAEHQASITQR
jgi:hypothetical protein